MSFHSSIRFPKNICRKILSSVSIFQLTERNTVLPDQDRAYFLMFVESKFYLERERNGKFVFGKFDGGKTN